MFAREGWRGGEEGNMRVPKTLDGNTKLYRIMSLERFLQMLESGMNTLVMPLMWEDPFEKTYELLYSEEVLHLGQYTIDVKVPIGKDYYGQCWSMCNESDALWRTYTNAKTQRSVKIETTIGQLEDSFKEIDNKVDFYIGQVSYTKNTNEKISVVVNELYDSLECYKDKTRRVLAALLSKRYAYKYEEEIRLIAYNENNSEKTFKYKIPQIDKFINRIELDPWTSKESISVIESAIRQRKWNDFKTWNVDIICSSLYKDITPEEFKSMKIYS